MERPDAADRFLPVGVQDFEIMRTGNFVYVDKTRYLHRMAKAPQGFYFLARPRRFGKSLTVSTLDHLFRGRRDLFQDLWISEIDWAWTAHPVVKLDFNTINFSTPDKLDASLRFHLRQIGQKHGIDAAIDSLPDAFALTLTELHRAHGERVVVLVDEYDKPIIEHIGKGPDRLAVARENREILKHFFGVLKGGDVSAALRFVFITGISKFARVSIFSDLNQLNDISMHSGYGELLGYTHSELLQYFGAEIDQLARETGRNRQRLLDRIRRWYNGYRFTANSGPVYNPFSIVRMLEAGEFKNYWFETATPSFLVELVRENQYPIAEIEGLKLPEESFTVYDIDHLQVEPLLFQTGYITIDGVEDDLYRMRYPNQEVRRSFLGYLLSDLAGAESPRIAGVYRMLHHHLRDMRMADFIEGVRTILASIPYTQIAGRTDEAFFHTVFYLMLSAAGVQARSEVLSSRGRMDMAVEFEDKVFLIELKCNQDAERAIRQILDRKYYEAYANSGRDIFLMGINFDAKERTITDWRCRPLDEAR